MDACPSATPSRTLMWFVSSRDVDAALNVKLALAALEAESLGWGSGSCTIPRQRRSSTLLSERCLRAVGRASKVSLSRAWALIFLEFDEATSHACKHRKYISKAPEIPP